MANSKDDQARKLDSKHTVMVSVRFTIDEYLRWKRQAEKSHMTLSNLVRSKLGISPSKQGNRKRTTQSFKLIRVS